MTSSKLKNPVEPNNASMLDSSFKVIIFTLLISNSTKYVLYPVGPINNIGSVSAHNKQLNKDRIKKWNPKNNPNATG